MKNLADDAVRFERVSPIFSLFSEKNKAISNLKAPFLVRIQRLIRPRNAVKNRVAAVR